MRMRMRKRRRWGFGRFGVIEIEGRNNRDDRKTANFHSYAVNRNWHNASTKKRPLVTISCQRLCHAILIFFALLFNKLRLILQITYFLFTLILFIHKNYECYSFLFVTIKTSHLFGRFNGNNIWSYELNYNKQN